MRDATPASSPAASSLTKSAPLYFPTLDGLRFLAFMLVFIHHMFPTPDLILHTITNFGWGGVHVFFALSAFLLTRLLRAEHEKTGTISVGRFFMRRGLRIWPLYFVVIAGATVIWGVRLEDTNGIVRLLGLLTFTDNILTGLASHEAFPYNPNPYLMHLWTIGLEEQFYLILPFVLKATLGRKKLLKVILLVTLAVFIILRGFAVAYGPPHPFLWTSVFSADALVLGMLLGLYDVPRNPGDQDQGRALGAGHARGRGRHKDARSAQRLAQCAPVFGAGVNRLRRVHVGPWRP